MERNRASKRDASVPRGYFLPNYAFLCKDRRVCGVFYSLHEIIWCSGMDTPAKASCLLDGLRTAIVTLFVDANHRVGCYSRYLLYGLLGSTSFSNCFARSESAVHLSLGGGLYLKAKLVRSVCPKPSSYSIVPAT